LHGRDDVEIVDGELEDRGFGRTLLLCNVEGIGRRGVKAGGMAREPPNPPTLAIALKDQMILHDWRSRLVHALAQGQHPKRQSPEHHQHQNRKWEGDGHNASQPGSGARLAIRPGAEACYQRDLFDQG
jgi:hypothetical protein